jgi:hypothetical protein
MRFTFGQFRTGARDPTYRVPLGRGRGFPTTTTILRRAVRIYHDYGVEIATTALEQGLSGYFSRPGPPGAQGARARRLFATYKELDQTDGRQAFAFDVKTELVVGEDILAVNVDVALLDPNGYAGRVLLWDRLACDREEGRVIAAPCAECLEEELGAERVDNIEVWHLQSRRRHAFTTAEALQALGSVASILARVAPEAA